MTCIDRFSNLAIINCGESTIFSNRIPEVSVERISLVAFETNEFVHLVSSVFKTMCEFSDTRLAKDFRHLSTYAFETLFSISRAGSTRPIDVSASYTFCINFAPIIAFIASGTLVDRAHNFIFSLRVRTVSKRKHTV